MQWPRVPELEILTGPGAGQRVWVDHIWWSGVRTRPPSPRSTPTAPTGTGVLRHQRGTTGAPLPPLALVRARRSGRGARRSGSHTQIRTCREDVDRRQVVRSSATRATAITMPARGGRPARRDEKAHGRRGGPFHTASDRKVRENADAARDPETDGKPCKPARLRSSRTRLKIVVSPVRVRVSPSTKGLHNGGFGNWRRRTPKRPKRSGGPFRRAGLRPSSRAWTSAGLPLAAGTRTPTTSAPSPRSTPTLSRGADALVNWRNVTALHVPRKARVRGRS